MKPLLRFRSPVACRGVVALTFSFFAAFTSVVADGQTVVAATPPAAAADSEPIVLTPFTVADQKVGRYQPTEAASGGRIAVSLLNAPQSVSVLTRELLDDVGGVRIETALQNVAGVTESTIPGAQDRITIRGFQTDGQTVDNFKSYSQANVDPVLIERLEVVKGPNAVLAPAGVPGGTINVVTRKPNFDGNFGSVMLEAGLFDAQRTEWDYNRVFGPSGTAAFRLLGSYQDTEGFASNPKKTLVLMPELSFRTKQGAQLTLQFRYDDATFQNYFGLPIDPSSGSTNDGRLLAGVSRKLNTFDSDFRHEHRPEYLALFTTPLLKGLSMRVAARYTKFATEQLQDLVGVSAALRGGGVDPMTGNYTPGVTYGKAPTFTPSPATPMPTIMTRSGVLQNDEWGYANLQNDFVYRLNTDRLSLTSLAGWAVNRSHDADLTYNTSKAAVNFLAFTPADGSYTLGALSRSQSVTNYDDQVYVTESVGLFKRVTFNAGYSANTYRLHTHDNPKALSYNLKLHAQLRSGGVVINPTDDTALYYTYSENATPAGWPDSLNTSYAVLAQGARPMQYGKQNEVGARANILGKRLFATVAYYSITQNNYGIQNPGNLANPPPVPPLPQLFSDQRAKGWEYELHASPTPELSLVANYTTFTNRDPNNVPFRGTAEHAGAITAGYEFTHASALNGLSLFATIDYEARRPGDAVSGLTPASTPDHPIPNQPTFWLPARTLVNIGGGYRINRHWSVRLNVYNLLNTDYLAAGLNRFVVVPGDPINVTARVYYRF